MKKLLLLTILAMVLVLVFFEPRIETIRYTSYWPPKGGTNCAVYDYEHRQCLSKTSSGLPWEAAIYWGAACPWPFWTVVISEHGVAVCVDRGPQWVDLMRPQMISDYKETLILIPRRQ